MSETADSGDSGDSAEQDSVKLEYRISELETQHGVDRPMIADLRHEASHHARDIEHLEAALVSARRIGAAIGIVMAATRRTEAEAFGLLSRVSQQQNRKLRLLADDIVSTGEVPI